MDRTLITRLLAGGRIAVGLSLFLAPGRSGRAWFGEVADEPGTKVATRAFGVRDLALGVGTLAALESGRDTTRWTEAGIIADVGDILATLLSRDTLPDGALPAVLTVAGGAAAAGAWLRREPVGAPR